MARSADWKGLRIGLAAAIGVAAAALSVLLFARVGTIRGDTFRLILRVGEARGLMRGSDVWIGGQKAGRVADIRFLPPGGKGADALAVQMDVLERHRQAIRQDSPVEIRAGGRLIAAPVVAIGPGSSGARVVRDGDTLRASPPADLDAMKARFGEATRELPAVVADVKGAIQQLRSPRGTIGAFGSEGGSVELAAVRARGSRLAASLGQGRGTLGRLLSARGPLQARAEIALARADSVQQLLGSPGAALGRFRRDSTLQATIADIQNEISIVRGMLSDARGTAGRVKHDRAIAEALTEAERELGAIMADIRRRPFRYLNF